MASARRDEGARRSGAWTGAWLLSAATLASGVLAYAFHVLAARTLGPDEYGRIAVLWGAMFLAAIVLFRPVEQTTSRAIADRLARGDGVRQVLRSASLVSAGATLIVILLAATLWRVLSDRLFGGDETLTWLLVAGVLAYGASYLVRGLLGGARWFAGYGLGLMADAIARLAVALPLIAVASTDLAAAAIVAAGVAGASIPLVVGRHRLRDALALRDGSPFRAAQAATFAAPAVVMAAADQILVNGSAVLVVIGGGAEASAVAAVVFAATMLVRVPVYVFQGVAASILPNLTHLAAVERPEVLARALRKASVVCLLAGAVVALGGLVIGPEAMHLVYGAEFQAGRAALAIVGGGVGLYLLASTLSQALLAIDRGRQAALGWAVAAAVFVATYYVLPGDPLWRVGIGFALGTALGSAIIAAGLTVELRRRSASWVPAQAPTAPTTVNVTTSRARV